MPQLSTSVLSLAALASQHTYTLAAITAHRRPAAPRPAFLANASYPVFWRVSGPNTSAFLPGGAVDVEQWGITYGDLQPLCGGVGGLWPSLPHAENSSGAVNGGVPQAANLSLHLAMTRKNIEARLADKDWAGLAVFDFEAWTPVWEDNTTPAKTNWHSVRYQAYSIALVKAKHPSWSAAQLEAQAKAEFEAAAMELFVATLKLAASLRPKALWGFYGMPGGDAAGQGGKDAAQMRPVWEASGALYPSIYLSSPLNARQRVTSTVSLAVATAEGIAAPGAKRLPVYPFAWECYHNGSALLTKEDLAIDLTAPYNAGADGVIVWGYTGGNDGITAQGGPQLEHYFEYIKENTGPLVQSFEKKVHACSARHCSAHGRCNTVSQDGPPPASATCRCFDGWSGADCSTRPS
jgi:hypothetical protein